MVAAYLLLFLSLPALADPKIQVVPAPKGPEDYEHEFKGCPENSECDQVMGLQMGRWKDLIDKLTHSELTASKKAQALEAFRVRYGLPVDFYTSKKSQQGFRPLYFNSPCKNHNPKGKEDERTLRGIAFIKSLSSQKAVVWRDQTQIEVPVGPLLTPQPVRIYYKSGPKTYQLPLGDQPLFIKDKNLYVLKEEESYFYFLQVSPEGKWKVEDVDFSTLGKYEDRKENVACPKDKDWTAPEPFQTEFCKKVWDEGQKDLVIVKMYLGCPT